MALSYPTLLRLYMWCDSFVLRAILLRYLYSRRFPACNFDIKIVCTVKVVL